jgi:putative oxidoreductase
VATIANALNICGLLLLGYLAGGIPAPLPGGDPLPDFREAFLILAGVVSLLLSGPGPFTASTTAAAATRRRSHASRA